MAAEFGWKPTSINVAVSNTAARLLSAGEQRSQAGIVIKALAANSAAVYVGGSDVTVNNGLELSAGESISLPVDDPSRVYVICAATQNVRVIY